MSDYNPSNSSNPSDPFSRISYEKEKKKNKKEIEKIEYIPNINNEELLTDILTNSIFQFYINENENNEKNNISYNLIKAGKNKFKK